MLKNVCKIATLAMVVLIMTGCVSTGGYNGMDRDPKRLAIVVCTERPCTLEQRALAGSLLIEAAGVVEKEMSGPGEAALTRGFVNAVTSAVATALTVANPLGGTVMAVTAADNASQGINEGLATFSYARTYALTAIADLLREDRIKLKIAGYDILEFVHIVPAFVRATSSMEEFRSGQIR